MIPVSCSQSKRLSLVAGLCALILAGCAAGTGMIDPSAARDKRQAAARQDGGGQQPSTPSQRDLLTPALNSINNRIHTYGQRIQEWQGAEHKAASLPREKVDKINECKAQLQDILNGYSTLQKRLLQDSRVDGVQLLAGDSLLQLNQQDIDYLESGCNRLLAELKAVPEPQIGTSLDPQIKAAFEGGDYDRVITLYGQIALTPGSIPAPEITFLYGRALVKNHQEAAARKALGDLLDRLRPQPGQEGLGSQVLLVQADLAFGLGSYEEARGHYEAYLRGGAERGQGKEWPGVQMVALQSGGASPEELQNYSGLLRNYLAYIPKRDGYAVAEQAEKFLLAYPASRLVANVNTIHKSTREQAEAGLRQGLQRIEAQAEERKNQEQPATAGQSPAEGATPAAQGGRADQGAPATVGDQPPAVDTKALQDEYDRGMTHLAAKEYSKAVERLTPLLKTSLADRARSPLEEASRLAAQEDRQKAADLFVRSTTSRDQENKKKLLLASRDLLQGILTKYPQSGLGEKVQRNLSRIEQELRAVDSVPAPVTPAKGGAYVPPAANAGNPLPAAGAL